MSDPTAIDGVLVQWGERLFYPRNRIVKALPAPRLSVPSLGQRAQAVRARIEAAVIRRAPQVMVKVTGGGRGMRAIAAHFRYISKNGKLDIEDDRGERLQGKDDLRGLVDDWRLGGTPIDEMGSRREAFNIMLSMPRGIDPLYVAAAAREFARAEFADHKYVMVLHDHQANPHVHLSVRAESRHGQRLNPRKADLARWRQVFAEKLKGWGIEAEASTRALKDLGRGSEPLWRIKAREDQRFRNGARASGRDDRMAEARTAWAVMGDALGRSDRPEDRQLGAAMAGFARTGKRVDARQVSRVVDREITR